MKLAQALNLRKKIGQDFSTTLSLTQAISVQTAGDKKPEQEPNELVQSLLDQMKGEWELIDKIDAVNSGTQLPNGMSIMQALNKRNVLAKRRSQMESLLHVSNRSGYGRETVGIVVLDLSKVRRIIDDLSRQWRELDDMIQQANWYVEL